MIIPEKVKKLGIQKERGYLYFVSLNGDVCRAKMVNVSSDDNSSKKKGPDVVVKCDYTVEPGYRYFLDKDGDIVRVTEEDFKKQERGEDFISNAY